ncbi:MAG: hypothetical protein MI785_03460 [Kiloniellales bacterium]|nr:hypothetical protein [Kiloniellales bacterium]
MTLDLPEWDSFWDLATPEQGAIAIMELCGSGAASAAADCAAVAYKDHRDEDYRFWTAVLARVRAAEGRHLETAETRLAIEPL